MFTGIVEQMGRVIESTPNGRDRRIVIGAEGIGEIPRGASIAVNGVCLTVMAAGDDQVSLDVIPETLNRTNLGSLRPGDQVNLELAMAGSGRFDGHIVQGHVDGTGTVASMTDDGTGSIITITADEALLRHVVEKGSISVDGVSLTVVSVDVGGFTVALIPHTLASTTLGLRRQGDLVNLETDVIAKYVARLIQERA